MINAIKNKEFFEDRGKYTRFKSLFEMMYPHIR
jgi:hypothetical protein